EFLGELSLTGHLRGVRGGLPSAMAAQARRRTLVLPQDNGAEAALAGNEFIRCAGHLAEVSASLVGTPQWTTPAVPGPAANVAGAADMAEVRGQHQARRALEIAAVGGHSILMTGPPGSGKTMLASRLPGILPPPSRELSLQTAAIASISRGGFQLDKWGQRPFRAPHHTASGVALMGGGSSPRPCEST